MEESSAREQQGWTHRLEKQASIHQLDVVQIGQLVNCHLLLPAAHSLPASSTDSDRGGSPSESSLADLADFLLDSSVTEVDATSPIPSGMIVRTAYQRNSCPRTAESVR